VLADNSGQPVFNHFHEDGPAFYSSPRHAAAGSEYVQNVFVDAVYGSYNRLGLPIAKAKYMDCCCFLPSTCFNDCERL